MNNKQYAQILSEIAVLKQLAGENPFRSRAYENAARILETHPESIEDVIARGEITEIDGIGKGLAAEIEQIYETGKSPTHTQLVNSLDPGLLDLMRIQGLGPKRIKLLYDELHITNVELLRAAAEAGQVSQLPGLGKKTEQKILQELDRLSQAADRMPLPAARSIAETIRDQLAAVEGVEMIEIAGSIRRGRETIGDVDILVATTGDPVQIFDKFVELREVTDVIARGETKTSARLRTGMQVDVRIVDPDQFGAALHYFTGSKEHNIQIRARAKQMGLRVNEYGVLRLEDEEWVASRTEEDLFRVLGLDWIPPEMREGREEVELAERHELPDLVDAGSIRGDLHMHTVETDGRNTVLEMAEAAKARGYDFIVVTDHSQAVAVANGMTPARFREHLARIRAANEEIEDFEIFAGIEVDILRDGELDMDQELLADADWVVGSVHSAMNQDVATMTDRLVKAVETGLLSALGHPTGRILGGRDGYAWDFDTVVEAAVEHSVAFEMNGSSGRLDLNAAMAEKIRNRGALLVLGSDAHSTRALKDMEFAVQQARRGWIQKHDVLNTRPAREIFEMVRPSLRA